jgi:hypothetical protein
MLSPFVERASGHEVFTPTTAGPGKRAHLFTWDRELGLHIENAAAVIDYEHLEDVVLLGQSDGAW